MKGVPGEKAETEEILIPGEMEFRTRETREKEGITILEKMWNRVVDQGAQLGVDVDALLAGERKQGR